MQINALQETNDEVFQFLQHTSYEIFSIILYCQDLALINLPNKKRIAVCTNPYTEETGHTYCHVFD
jgi:hypothetical protein